MGVILSIETSTKAGSVAIHANGELLGTTLLILENSHSRSTAESIQHLLKYCQLEVRDLQAVAVSSGPGSYTGLRIGYSIAKGLCMGAAIPLIELPTLQIIAAAYPFAKQGTLIIPTIDARRMEVYDAVYDHTLTEVRGQEATVVDADTYLKWLESCEEIILTGDGAFKLKHLLNNYEFVIHPSHPEARYMGLLAMQKFDNQQFADIAYAVPNYLKQANVTMPSKRN